MQLKEINITTVIKRLLRNIGIKRSIIDRKRDVRKEKLLTLLDEIKYLVGLLNSPIIAETSNVITQDINKKINHIKEIYN